ncbi:hypothetical protein VTH06DRAFT_2213 [Thermothelomyces fergusii]
MEQQPPSTTSQAGPAPDAPPSTALRPTAPGRKRSSSGASGLLTKLSFVRSSGEHRPRSRRNTNETESAASIPTTLPVPSFTTIPASPPQPQPQPPPRLQVAQQYSQHSTLQAVHKTRRRRGSLRKVALLGRGALRERREGRALTIDTTLDDGSGRIPYRVVTSCAEQTLSSPEPRDGRAAVAAIQKDGRADLRHGLGILEMTPRPGTEDYGPRSAAFPSSGPGAAPTALLVASPAMLQRANSDAAGSAANRSPSISYSTTDDEDALHMARSNPSTLPIPRSTNPSVSLSSSSVISLPHPDRGSISSGSESYYLARPPGGGHGSGGGGGGVGAMGGPLSAAQRRRSATMQRAKSPLALTSLAAPLPQADAEWDYSETEWWGWIILLVTWVVFVVGMGSCLGVWSWAWDVGTTPYAPPELEDDPTLPIVGYYPALMILTGVMAWVWVVVAWVGMKYFRHAHVSGD